MFPRFSWLLWYICFIQKKNILQAEVTSVFLLFLPLLYCLVKSECKTSKASAWGVTPESPRCSEVQRRASALLGLPEKHVCFSFINKLGTWADPMAGRGDGLDTMSICKSPRTAVTSGIQSSKNRRINIQGWSCLVWLIATNIKHGSSLVVIAVIVVEESQYLRFLMDFYSFQKKKKKSD